VYGCGSQSERFKDELPKANFGKGCIRFKKPEDVDLRALEKIVKAGAREREKANAAASGK